MLFYPEKEPPVQTQSPKGNIELKCPEGRELSRATAIEGNNGLADGVTFLNLNGPMLAYMEEFCLGRSAMCTLPPKWPDPANAATALLEVNVACRRKGDTSCTFKYCCDKKSWSMPLY